MPGPLQVYLVPGFFGFVNFGNLIYFSHVREILETELASRGCKAVIHRCNVSPTASIATRASELLDFIRDTSSDEPIAIIGHSTGGLDARLLVSPGVNLGNGSDVEGIAARVKTITSIATPHHGTPMATFFNGLLGQRLLRILSLATVEILREGPIPVAMMAKIGATLARIRLPSSKSAQVLDHLYEDLLGRLPMTERDQIADFMADVVADQALVPQLTPAGLDLFNAATNERETTRYGCVVTRAARPSLRNRIALRLELGRHAGYAFYRLIHSVSGFADGDISWNLGSEHRSALLRAYGQEVVPSDNDGIVPTLSQVHGKLLFAASADHLDVIGHFDDESHQPPHHDWLTTCSHFNRGRFEQLWSSIADFIHNDEGS